MEIELVANEEITVTTDDAFKVSSPPPSLQHNTPTRQNMPRALVVTLCLWLHACTLATDKVHQGHALCRLQEHHQGYVNETCVCVCVCVCV